MQQKIEVVCYYQSPNAERVDQGLSMLLVFGGELQTVDATGGVYRSLTADTFVGSFQVPSESKSVPCSHAGAVTSDGRVFDNVVGSRTRP
jgi:hypothetical protein